MSAAKTTQPNSAMNRTEGKSYLTASLFSILLGGLAVDRFYLGYVGLGILKLITFGGCGIWYTVDVILNITGNMKDVNGDKLVGYEQNKKIVWIVAAVLYVMSALSGLFYGPMYQDMINDMKKAQDGPVETTDQTKTSPTTTTTPEAQPAEEEINFTPVSVSGTGSKTSEEVDLLKGENTFDVTHNGSGDFIVELIDAKGESAGHIVHASGNHMSKETFNVPADGSYKLKVTADGPWMVTVSHQ